MHVGLCNGMQPAAPHIHIQTRMVLEGLVEVAYDLCWFPTLDETLPSLGRKAGHVWVWVLHAHTLAVHIRLLFVAKYAQAPVISSPIFTKARPWNGVIDLLHQLIATFDT